jgi:hypothetical protein
MSRSRETTDAAQGLGPLLTSGWAKYQISAILGSWEGYWIALGDNNDKKFNYMFESDAYSILGGSMI